ncbi:MAG TPA: S1 RNA-binding domain-containing protein [Thermotogota bacterium]|nr:S1 RNA-binding domain-containing protein [Thermotogota bacterium]HRW34434.1 S1 RNA-binding domain-containing protein [Thermotogota bacterium]
MVDGKDGQEITNMEEVMEELERSDTFLADPKKGSLVTVQVWEVHDNELLVKSGGKSEGMISKDDLVKDISEYQPGDQLDGIITYINEEDGHIKISEKKRVLKEILNNLKDYQALGTPVKGKIIAKNKGGYVVKLFGVLQAFLPTSHSMLEKNADPEGIEMEFEIIDLRYRRKGSPNIVLSRKNIQQKVIDQFMGNVSEGKVVEGKVEGIEKFGVFVDLGPITGLIPRSELTYDRELEPKDVVDIGDPVNVMVLRIDKKSNKVTLSRKRLQPDPWTGIEAKHPLGSKVKGEVIRILPFGFVVKIEPGLEGLVHTSEIFWTNRRMDIRAVVQEGEQVEVEVIGIDKEKRKLSLSLKKVKGNPWEDVEKRFPVGKVLDAKVVKILPSGLIAELEEGISGFVHVTEMSWNFLDNIEDAYGIGDDVKVSVMEVLPDEQRIRLSIRNITPDPWKRASEELNKGNEVKGKVVRMTNTGATVMLDDYNIEAFLPVSQISVQRVEKPEDVLKVGDEVDAKVVRTVYEPEKERRNMVISIKQKEVDEEKTDYQQYMDKDESTVTMHELMKEKGKE